MDISELTEAMNIRRVKEWMGAHGVKDTACAYLFLVLALKGSKSYQDFENYSCENLRKVKSVMSDLKECGLVSINHGVGNIAYVKVEWRKVEECFGDEEQNRVDECEYIRVQVKRREDRRRQVASNSNSDTVKYITKCLEAYEEVFGKTLPRDGYCVGALLKIKDRCFEVCTHEGLTIKEWATLKWKCIQMEGQKDGGRIEDEDYNRFIRTRDHVEELRAELRRLEGRNFDVGKRPEGQPPQREEEDIFRS